MFRCPLGWFAPGYCFRNNFRPTLQILRQDSKEWNQRGSWTFARGIFVILHLFILTNKGVCFKLQRRRGAHSRNGKGARWIRFCKYFTFWRFFRSQTPQAISSTGKYIITFTAFFYFNFLILLSEVERWIGFVSRSGTTSAQYWSSSLVEM